MSFIQLSHTGTHMCAVQASYHINDLGQFDGHVDSELVLFILHWPNVSVVAVLIQQVIVEALGSCVAMETGRLEADDCQKNYRMET